MSTRVRSGVAAAAAALATALLVAGCGGREGGPAPLVTGDRDMPAAGYVAPPPALPPPPPRGPLPPRAVPMAARQPLRITVARGDSLSSLAQKHHVPERVLIEANHLQPPYKVRLGSTLLIPGGAAMPEPAARLAAAPPPGKPAIPAPHAAAAAPPPRKAPPAIAAARPGPPATRPPSHGPAAEVAADIAAAEDHPPATKPVPRTLSLPPPERLAEKPGPAEKPAPASARPGGGFLWPVRGHVLASYGTGPDGTHNDGINIAAPKGAPVEAADAGTVAYAGNELRGYGNLILIKHPSGWITAYAHCEEILVKRGQKVGRGQTIARVGATGSVKEPQLHFELRRGDHPVDPRGLLAPAPTAAAGKPSPPG